MIKYLAKNSFIVTFIVVFIANGVLDKIFNVDSFFIRVAIAALITIPLIPRKKKIETQTGKKTQITWFLLKEPIFLDE